MAPGYVGTAREESTSEEGLTKFIRLVLKSDILPSSNLVQQYWFIEVSLAAILIETL